MANEKLTTLENEETNNIKLPKQAALATVGFSYGGLLLISLITELIYLLFQPLISVGTVEEAHLARSMFINFGCYSLLLLVLLLIVNKDLLGILKGFKNKDAYLAGFACFTISLIFQMVYTEIISWFKVPVVDNVNEQSLDSIITVYPALSIIAFGIFGPICEELTYRVGLFSLLKRKSKVFAYVVSSLVFGFIHFTFNGDIVTELINLPLYVSSGLLFAWVYDRFGLVGSLTAHMTNNLISICGSLVVLNRK